MTCTADRDLPNLLELAACALPGLDGKLDAITPELLLPGAAGEAARLERLAWHWRRAHPEAGAHYWSARVWTLLVWQPVYLSLIGAHLGRCAPRLDGMAQLQRDGYVMGFRLPSHTPCTGDEDARLAFAAGQLRERLETQWQALAPIQPLHRKMAMRLAADYLLDGLLLVQRRRQLDNARVQQLRERWLRALDLEGASGLIEVRLDDGRTPLALERKVCCQHFRRADGSLCSTCPKLSADERMVRLRRELALPCSA